MKAKKILSRAAVAGLLFLAAPFAFAQTTTPGTPDTGVGGYAAGNALVLGVLAAAALGAVAYLARRKALRS